MDVAGAADLIDVDCDDIPFGRNQTAAGVLLAVGSA
jgi:hypothetical protein